MKTWRITAAAVLAAAALLAPVAAQAAVPPPVGWGCGSGDSARLQDGYGQITGNGAAATLTADGSGDYFCTQAASEGGNWTNLLDTDFYSGYLTWVKSTNGLNVTTVSYPASQAWEWLQLPNGNLELKNDYSGTCLAGETTGDDLYMYTCLTNGAKSLDWEPIN